MRIIAQNYYLSEHVLAVVRLFILLFYFIGINTVLFIIYLTRPFHRNNVYLAGIFYSSMSKILGVTVELRTSSQIDTNKSYVFIANHQSTYDLMTICKAALPGVVTVGKKSLKWIPIFGLIYWLSANIMIDRKNKGNARDTLEQTARKMREKNLSVWFFPEGTRSYGRGLLPFKTGAFRLAKTTNSEIVPVIASNLHEKVKLNRWNNGTVIIQVLDPIKIDKEQNAKQLASHFHAIIENEFNEISAEADTATD